MCDIVDQNENIVFNHSDVPDATNASICNVEPSTAVFGDCQSSHEQLHESSNRISSAIKKIVPSEGHAEKPALRAGKSYHKYRVKKNNRHKVRGAMATNLVKRPYQSNYLQYNYHAPTPGMKLGLIGARKTGRVSRGARIAASSNIDTV